MSGLDLTQQGCQAELTLGPVAEHGGRVQHCGRMFAVDRLPTAPLQEKERKLMLRVYTVLHGESLERQEKCSSCFCHSLYVWLVVNDYQSDLKIKS